MKPLLALGALERLGWRFGLETIAALLFELGDPHLSLKCVHVSGSNGKGSTCAFLAKSLQKAGYRTGLYTSPHLSDLRERFRIDGTWIPAEDLDRLARKVLEACGTVREKLGHLPTHFEALTALAFLWFKERNVDWAVLEVGLGGRLDATNVIPFSGVSLITPIALEHQDILGRTLGRIAREKAGILKPHGMAATIQIRPEAAQAIEEDAREKKVLLWMGGRDFHYKERPDGFDWEGPGLTGRFLLPKTGSAQRTNAALALAGFQALRMQGVRGGRSIFQDALRTMRWPGRLEKVARDPWVLLDGAHNPDAARSLREVLSFRHPGKRWIVLNGLLRDKDGEGIVRELRDLTEFSIATEPRSERALPARRLAGLWKKEKVPGLALKGPRRALTAALREAKRRGCPLLVTGSLYLVGDLRKIFLGLDGLDRI